MRIMLQPVKKAKKNDGAAAPKAAAKSGVDTSATNGSKTVFCKNLPWGATDDDLWSAPIVLPACSIILPYILQRSHVQTHKKKSFTRLFS